MNQPIEPEPDDSMTLDPPGSIAVVGAGPVGIEAALYGRYLGYDVTLLEATAVASSLLDRQELPLPMLPNRALSPLAILALNAQQLGGSGVIAEATGATPAQPLPMTYGQWIKHSLIPLTETDLLRGRVKIPARVTGIETVPVQPDQEGEDTSDIPADFRLTTLDGQGQRATLDVEAVILAIGASPPIELGFSPPTPYFFQIGRHRSDDPQHDLRSALREVVAAYAGLMGRSNLDLYRPRRG